jgi:hypothetical protein
MSGGTRRERLKPLELVGMAAVLGVFTGGISFGATRELQLALVFAGIAFIAGLLMLAMLALAAGGPEDDADDRPVLDRHDPKPDAAEDVRPRPGQAETPERGDERA